MMDLIRKPLPKWNILYQNSEGKFLNELVYTDAERDSFVAQVEAAGGTVIRTYER